MGAMANTTPLVTTVTKPATNLRDVDATPRVNIQEFCEEYYEDILPIIMDKVRRHRRQSAFDRLSETYSPSTTKSRPRGTDSRDRPRGKSCPHMLDTSNEDCPKDRERFRSVGESYDDSFSHSYRDGNRSHHMKRRRDNESPLSSVSKSDSSDGRRRDNESPLSSVSKSDSSDGRYQKSRLKRHKSTDEDDLTRPWMCEEEDPDPEDHVKIFQAAAQVERWAMPTWCHMFNSTLIGAARVWFDELPPEIIDYKDLKAALLAYFMKQKKYVKDPVKIHNIKQKDGETIEDFMERFKVETKRMKGAPECMRIFRFMHGIDWKVESLCGYPFKCFLDAYKGYHQIQLAEPDEEKTTFHTGQGVYCYIKMPFGLKNVGATYQRLMDKAFDSQIGWNIEVYVDDLVVKSYTEAEMLRYIDETFHTLRIINMKLNPKKCTFGVAEGVFLGYVVTPDGIKPILADFLIEMPNENPPATPVAETQQEPWTLFTDGLSCVDGSGARLILTNLEGIVFTYAQRFQFAASNNEAEYEALIAGLRIAAQMGMGVQNVYVSVDSKLVANQVLGTYVAKEENMVKYLDKVKSLVRGFINFLISQVPRSKNKKADALSKIASTSFAHLSKQEGGKKAPHKGPTVRIIGGNSLQAVVPYVVVKMCWTAPGRKEQTKVWEKESRPAWARGLRIRLKNSPTSIGPIMIKSSHGDTPFSPTYGTEVVIPAEIGMLTYRTAAVDVVYNDEVLRLNQDLLEERRERAAICKAKAKLKMMKYYNARVRDVTFRPGDFIYRSNDASHAVAGGKLGPKWERPYEVTDALGDGAYKLRSMDGTILPRTWNITNLKRCYL
uniref:Reverse transcriptase domain-containing protein n=1 Tax=Tanacetum cinerariifolium TaxID=118510 RepID=A0A6L2N3W7_TANCI|nr:reverse transcriptase domain-containing protein [Tanacetum cinerariifolium]